MFSPITHICVDQYIPHSVTQFRRSVSLCMIDVWLKLLAIVIVIMQLALPLWQQQQVKRHKQLFNYSTNVQRPAAARSAWSN